MGLTDLNLSQQQITLRQPDDWHLHLRDDDILDAVVVPSARVFKRAVVMPNLSPPIKSIEEENSNLGFIAAITNSQGIMDLNIKHIEQEAKC